MCEAYSPIMRTYCRFRSVLTNSLSEHKHSGYRWTRNEISMKVRMIVAESAGKPPGSDPTGDPVA
jgi:hypothetical protein